MKSDRTEAPLRNEVDDLDQARPKRGRWRGEVTVFDNWCKGCGLCIAFCPQKVFEAGPDGHPVVAHEERCTGCNWCYYHCPDLAIRIELVPLSEQSEEASSRERSSREQ